MERKEREERIIEACDQAGCNDKLRKIHFDQFVSRRWDPHPPSDFALWFASHPDAGFGVKIKVAWNCQCYRDQFSNERVQYGI